jgi:hypothetical protein
MENKMYGDEKYKIKVKIYDKKGKETPNPVEISVHSVAKAFTDEQFAEMLSDYMNCYCNEYLKGQDIGKLLQCSHRTLQGSIARLFLGVLVGIGDTEYFDARNEKAVALGKKLRAMIESGELNFGYMI